MTKSEATKLSEEMVKDLGEGWVADTYEPFRDSWVSRALKDKVSVYKSGGCYAYAATVSNGVSCQEYADPGRGRGACGVVPGDGMTDLDHARELADGIAEAVAVLRNVLDGMNVCHVCGDVLCAPNAGAIVAYGRCVSHGSAEDDEEGGEPWHIPANEWKRRLEAAKLLTERAGR